EPHCSHRQAARIVFIDCVAGQPDSLDLGCGVAVPGDCGVQVPKDRVAVNAGNIPGWARAGVCQRISSSNEYENQELTRSSSMHQGSLFVKWKTVDKTLEALRRAEAENLIGGKWSRISGWNQQLHYRNFASPPRSRRCSIACLDFWWSWDSAHAT